MATQDTKATPVARKYMETPLRFILPAISCLSLVSIIPGIIYAIKLYQTPELVDFRWPKAYFVFFYGTMPFLSIFHPLLDCYLLFTGILHPVYALLSSTLFLSGWIVQLFFWMSCGFYLKPAFQACYSIYYLYVIFLRRVLAMHNDLDPGLVIAMVVLGFVVGALYLAYVIVSIMRILGARKVRKQSPGKV